MTINIAIVCINYDYNTSPTVKGAISFLMDHGEKVDVFSTVEPQEAFIHHQPINFKKINIESKFINRLRLPRKLAVYDQIICVEFLALQLVSNYVKDLSRVIYLSLEGVQLIVASNVKKTIAADLLQKCGIRIIQSKERQHDLEQILDTNLDFEYLPVSLRPFQTTKTNNFKKEYPIKMVYSGYFSTWSCIDEFVESISSDPSLEDKVKVTLQGALYEANYLESMQQMTAQNRVIILDNTYYDDQKLRSLIEKNDIGIAFYKVPADSPEMATNWQNLIFSSGKIASYLWSGLAVLTNLDDPLTKSPPFLFVPKIDVTNIINALNLYIKSKENYVQSALRCAEKYYNFDYYMDTIYNNKMKK